METIETFGFPQVVAMHNHGANFALVQTETVEGEYIDLMIPWAAARTLNVELETVLKELE